MQPWGAEPMAADRLDCTLTVGGGLQAEFEVVMRAAGGSGE